MAMDFFAHEERARKNTKLMVLLMLLSVAAIIAAVYFVVVALFFYTKAPDQVFLWWKPKTALYVACGVVSLVTIGSLYKTIQLGSDGGVVSRMMGGILVDPDTRDAGERRLLNVVQEMSIASGVPVPDVYILPEEQGINAFAAGLETSKATVTVTRGCIDNLTRDELQGVVAHEFSHILRGDMKINLRMIGILHGILLLGIVGYWLLRSSVFRGSSRGRNKGNQLVLLGIGLLVIGYVGVFFGKLIKAALSRQREFLADASAVQFTRNDWGLVGALKKIGGLSAGSRLSTPNAEQASHMFFSNALSQAWFSAMATHPPLEERIKRLEPGYKPETETATGLGGKTGAAGAEGRAMGFAGAPGPVRQVGQVSTAAAQAGPAKSAGAGNNVDVTNMVASIGRPEKKHLEYAKKVMNTISQPLVEATRTPFSARAVVYCLLLDRNAEIRQAQVKMLASKADKPVFSEVVRLENFAFDLAVEHKLPLFDLCLPSLRGMSAAQYQHFIEVVETLARADNRIDLFEFMLSHSLKRHLGAAFEKAQKKKTRQKLSVKSFKQAVKTILSVLAEAAGQNEIKQMQAFKAGAQALGMKPEEMDRSNAGLENLEHALKRLSSISPSTKRKVIQAAVDCVAADGFATLGEAELLRAIADGLGCPTPPVWPGQEL
ncbi:MAG: M48 family metallopeptidase [Deltaproteobacteria bacterium]|nr:M48 family metallopeptidase [Deltaproteobacteria bacterium]